MSEAGRGCVVVGFDLSDKSRRAVWWAAREAGSRGCPLLLLHVFSWPVAELAAGTVPGQEQITEPLQQELRHELGVLVDGCREITPGIDVRSYLPIGDPAEVLGTTATEAVLLVLGAVGGGNAHRSGLGSTSAELLARRSGTPVVIVRGEEPASDTAPVVVGVDGSTVSDRAIAFAFDFAARRGSDLVAVHSLTDVPLDPYIRVKRWELPWDDLRKGGLTVVSRSLEDWTKRYPKVTVRRSISAEQAPQALFNEAAGAAVLVVGSHGRGRVRRMMLGSVSHSVVHHAPCPVAVMLRDGATTSAGEPR